MIQPKHLLYSKKAWIFYALLLAIIIYLVFNLKTVPNYANYFGVDIVSKSTYDKYHNEGYCPAEGRILSTEEKFQEAIGQWLDKKVTLVSMINDYRCKKGIRSYCREMPKYFKYYVLSGVDSDTWYEKFTNIYDSENGVHLLKILFEEFNATHVDPKEYLIINTETMTAGFTRPIVFLSRVYHWELYLEHNFVLQRKPMLTFGYNTIFIGGGQISIRTLKHDKRYYEQRSKKSSDYKRRIDNCGNIEFNVKKTYKELIEFNVKKTTKNVGS